MDIVERLQAAGADDSDGQSTFAALEREAANEIARLRDENESLRGSLEEWRLDLNSLRDENAKLSALLLWALYHHQGGSSEVGQPIRRALGIGQYDHLTPSQIEMAKSAAIAQEMTDSKGDTTEEPSEWTFGSMPIEAGWYATLHCWDIQEGAFPGASYWDGLVWKPAFPITAYAGPFEDDVTAKQWAEAHDPDK